MEKEDRLEVRGLNLFDEWLVEFLFSVSHCYAIFAPLHVLSLDVGYIVFVVILGCCFSNFLSYLSAGGTRL